MKTIYVICILSLFLLFSNCNRNKLEKKGFAVNTESRTEKEINELQTDSLVFETKPGDILLTGHPQYRLTTIYKVNYNKKEKRTFIGSNDFYYNYSNMGRKNGNQWNYNYMPGLEAVYGYNMINVSHYDTKEQKQKTFFEKPVLINTLYYPSFSNDTLNYKPVKRDYFLVSVYDDDTNRDGIINTKDLRRLYFFDIKADNQKLIVPANYSVIKSDYDPANDYMYIFAQQDENKNGQRDEGEAIHIFWIDLKNPDNNGQLY